MGLTVFEYGWKGYSKNKNFGNKQAQSDWILSIDADEVLSDELIKSIQSLVLEKDTVYELDRANHFCGQWIQHSGWYPDWKVRVFNKKSVEWKGDFVHENLVISSNLKRIKIKGKLLHYSYQTIQIILKESNDTVNWLLRKCRLPGKNSPVLKCMDLQFSGL